MKPSEWIEMELIRVLRSEEWSSRSATAVAHARVGAVIAYLDAEHDRLHAPERDTVLPPPPSSPMFCEHANECPHICPCQPDCYCRRHTCARTGPSGAEPTLPPAGANGPSES